MIANLKLIAVLLCAACSIEVSASNGSSLNGTWAVDIEATERSVLEMSARPDALALVQSLVGMGGYLAVSTLTIGDDFAAFTMGNPTGKEPKLKLVSQDRTESRYAAANEKDSSKPTLTVTILGSEHVRVRTPQDPLGSILLWKRTPPVTNQPREAFDLRVSAWSASAERIKNHLFALDIRQAKPVPPKRWRDDVLLQDGQRIEVEREVSYSFDHSIGDAGSGYRTFRNRVRTFRLQFNHPKTGRPVVWQGEPSISPVLLDLVDGVPYLVLSARPTKKTERVYGCTELPFIYLQYDSKLQNAWRPVPEDQAPRALKKANLFFGDETSVKDRMSVDEVQASIAQSEESSRRFVQREIPKDYGEWRYLHKNSYRNERRQDDCRPPRVPPLQLALPAPIEGSPEILETVDYAPPRIAVNDEWSNVAFDQKRESECRNLFRATDPDDHMQGQRFVKDSSGKKPAPYSRTAQFNPGVRVLCDDDVWFVAHLEEQGKIIISRFTVTGDLVFRTSFRNPDRVEGFTGYIRIPSLRSEAGYLYFDWLDFRNVNREWHIKRWLKMRMKEPTLRAVSK